MRAREALRPPDSQAKLEYPAPSKIPAMIEASNLYAKKTGAPMSTRKTNHKKGSVRKKELLYFAPTSGVSSSCTIDIWFLRPMTKASSKPDRSGGAPAFLSEISLFIKKC